MIDQFEELFTLSPENERTAFIAHLLDSITKMKIVVTMRADFWGECAPYRDLTELMQAHQELIGPMNTAELRAAMEQQARKVGLRFEADLSNTILDAVKGEPGAMPLLQHALLEMWKRRHGRWLKTDEYRAIGGVQKAIAETAESIYAEVEPVEQQLIRDIFVRLTRLDADSVAGEERRDTRQRVRFDELIPADGEISVVRNLVQRLATVRLIVTSLNEATGQEEVEVAHEALIRHWPRLQTWLDEDRDLLRLRSGIRQAAQEWEEEAEEEKGHLLIHRGSRLEEIEALLNIKRLGLNVLEQGYIDACIQLREDIKAKEEAQRIRELKQARKLATEAEARREAEAQRAQEAELREQEQAQAATNLRKRFYMILAVGVVAIILAFAAAGFGVQSSRNAEIAANNASTANAESTKAFQQEQLAISNAEIAETNEAVANVESTKAIQQEQLALAHASTSEANEVIANTESTKAIQQEELAVANAATAEAEKERAIAAEETAEAERAEARTATRYCAIPTIGG